MKIDVTRADWRRAGETHRLFSAKPHAEHIASKFALAHLAAILRTYDVRSVLEFGAGIGTLTYLLLASRHDLTVVCTERKSLCLNCLEQNIPSGMRERLTIHAENPPSIEGTFDLVIIDGKIKNALFLKPGSISFVEGQRTRERRNLETLLNEYGMTCEFTNHLQWRLEIAWQRPKWRPLRRLRGWGMEEIKVPILVRRKGCWIGRVEPVRALQGVRAGF